MALGLGASFVLHAGLFAAAAYVAGGGGGGVEGGDEPTSFAIHVRTGASSSAVSELQPSSPQAPEQEVAAEVGVQPSPTDPEEAPSQPIRDESSAPATPPTAPPTHEAPSPGSGGGAGSGAGSGSGSRGGEGADGRGPAVVSSPARLVFDPRPDYPPASVRHGEEGSVLCAMRVGPDGRVEDVEILRSSGHPGLDRAASEGLRRWIFEPAREDGQAVAARVLHQVVFRLD